MTTTRTGSGNNVRKDFKELRAKEAQDRQVAWTALGPEGQLKALNERSGKSLKQRARLEALIGKRKVKPVVSAVQTMASAVTKEIAQEIAEINTASNNRPKAKDRRAAEQARQAAK